MVRLRPYRAGDAQTILSWIKDEYSFRLWSADRYDRYPITPEEMNRYYEKEKDRNRMWALTALDDSGMVGHLTLRFPREEQDELRFGFVIVNDQLRGRGYGKEMLRLAVEYAFTFFKVEKITLSVFENNEKARKCYEACGFHRTEKKAEEYLCMGENWRCIEMEIKEEREK